MTSTFQITANVRQSKGFSLVEMTVVIAVLGIISMLVVPAVGNVAGKVGHAQDQRNAQSLAQMANNAVAAGNVEIPAATSVDEVVDLLIAGVTGSGSFEGTVFEVSNLTFADRAAAVALLSWDGDLLKFDPNA